MQSSNSVWALLCIVESSACVPLAKAVAGLKMERDTPCSELPQYQRCCTALLGVYASLAVSEWEVKFQKTGGIHMTISS